MSTGYYQEHMTPPEYLGKRWEQRAPNSESGTIASPFPPATLGNPAEDVPAFRDFQNWQGRNHRSEHPEDYCSDCGIRYATARCALKACQSGRTVLETGGRYRCVSCGHNFYAERLCGPCIGARQAAQPAGRIA